LKRPRGIIVFIGLICVAAAWVIWRRTGPQPESLRPAVTPVGPHQGRVSVVLAEAGRPIVTADVHGRLVVWRDPVLSWVAHDGSIRTVSWHDDKLLTIGGDGSAALWGPQGAVQWRRRHPEALNDGVLIGDALVVATVRGTVARLGPDRPIWESRGAHGQAAFAALAGGDSVFTAGDDGRIVERGAKAGAVRREWKASVHWIGALAKGPAGLVFGDGAGQLGVQWADGFSIQPAIKGPAVALAVQGGLVAIGGETGQITLTTVPLSLLPLSQTKPAADPNPVTWQTGEPVLSLAFQGETLLSGGRLDGSVMIWRVKDGVEVGRLPPEPSKPEPSKPEPSKSGPLKPESSTKEPQ
jgi:WD40 repeat protein